MKPSVRRTFAAALTVISAQAVAVSGERGEGVAPALLAPGQAMEYVFGVVTVMVALGVFAFVLRRLQQRQVIGGGSQVRVCASLPLGGKERLLVVEADGERLLLGVSPGGVQLVHRLPAPDNPPPTTEAVEGNWLGRVLNGEGNR